MKTNTVAIRADSSVEIGSGHVVRCLALAEHLRKRGVSVHFLARELGAQHLAAMARHGIEFHRLAGTGPGMAQSWQDDAKETDARLAEIGNCDWLVVDHYGLDARWEKRMSERGCRILVIDDLCDRPHVCDALVDQTMGRTAGEYRDWVNPECTVFAGEHFVLLRPQFPKRRGSGSTPKRKVQRLLIHMGSTDPENVTSIALEGVRQAGFSGPIDIILDSRAPALPEIHEQRSALVTVHTDVHDVATLMAKASLAIGAAGSSSWERCCLGLPSLVIVTADNQCGIADALDRAGAATILGTSGEITATMITTKLKTLMINGGLLFGMSVAARAICDGLGAERLAEFMVS